MTKIELRKVLNYLFDDWLTLTGQDAGDLDADVISLTEKVQTALNEVKS